MNKREKAISNFRKHWKWLSDNPLCFKEEYQGISSSNILNDCFLCHYERESNKTAFDCKCPIDWGRTEKRMLPCERGLYKYYRSVSTPEMSDYYLPRVNLILPSGLSKIYKRISELPKV